MCFFALNGAFCGWPGLLVICVGRHGTPTQILSHCQQVCNGLGRGVQECGCLPVAQMCTAIARGYVIVDLFVRECLLFFGMLFICTGMLFDRKHPRS